MKIGAVRLWKKYPDAIAPARKSDGAVGYDICAHNVQSKDSERRIINDLQEPVIIPPGGAMLFGIGVVIELPRGYEIQVRPRSGLANKHDVELSNAPGTVDPDFRGEVGVLLRNRGKKPFEVKKEMRIAQLIFSQVETPTFIEVVDKSLLSVTRRGPGGFGHTALFGDGVGTSQYDAEVTKLDRYHMRIVVETAKLSDCIRGCERNVEGVYPRDEQDCFVGQTRRFGATFSKGIRVIGSGFNCQYPGTPKCADVGCLRDQLGIPSGEQIDICRAIHAEQMAINAVAGSGESIEDATLNVNAEPCQYCARMIAGLKLYGLETLVVLKGQYHNNGLDTVREAGIIVREIEL